MTTRATPLQRRVQIGGSPPWHEGDGEIIFTSKPDSEECIRLARHQDPLGDRIVVSWTQRTEKNVLGQGKYEQFKTYALALRRIANILEGKVSFLEFATQPSQKPGSIPA